MFLYLRKINMDDVDITKSCDVEKDILLDV